MGAERAEAPVTIDRRDPVVPECWSAAAWAALSSQPPFTTERFTVLFLDADGLKAVNDGEGYDAGNRYLRGLGVLL